jgi:hypothetical protein
LAAFSKTPVTLMTAQVSVESERCEERPSKFVEHVVFGGQPPPEVLASSSFKSYCLISNVLEKRRNDGFHWFLSIKSLPEKIHDRHSPPQVVPDGNDVF